MSLKPSADKPLDRATLDFARRLAEAVADEFGPMPAHGARTVAQRLADLLLAERA
ncbi:MAG TPA: hypothetical protein VHM25_28420 [Polyangiaceae bacterium]|jgi:hypothetical protein|nr:hypothetical protein [Polyangiaceae bacterium]